MQACLRPLGVAKPQVGGAWAPKFGAIRETASYQLQIDSRDCVRELNQLFQHSLRYFLRKNERHIQREATDGQSPCTEP